MNTERTLIEDCCGWNRKIWADAIEFAVSQLPADLAGRTALEIGASDRSTVVPILAARGAEASCSYYMKPPDFIVNGRLKYIYDKYHIKGISILEADIRNISGQYDIIIMKSVLGGVCRNGHYEGIKEILTRMVAHNLTQRGVILTLDNGYIQLFQALRKALGTGGNTWSYLRTEQFAESLSDFDVTMKGFGFLNVASASLQFGVNCEFINDLAYHLDRIVLRLLNPRERAVLSTVIRARVENVVVAQTARRDLAFAGRPAGHAA